jgi:broad specificity phosphatase PhoE
MLTVFYSPHSTSVDNEAGRASGHADVPLSTLGRQQAREIGQHYAAEAIDAVFSSDLQRASTTAEIAFAARGIPIMQDARLRECDYGEMTQCPVAQIDEEFPRRITEPFPNGQSVLMVVQGVGTFLHDALSKYNGKTIVLIGHRATRYALAFWFGNSSLKDVVCGGWEWRDIPIWRYELHAHHLLGTDSGKARSRYKKIVR